MQLDVIIPTYNRADLLKLTLQSLLAAEIPAGLNVQVTVVDNNSTDETHQTVSAFQSLFAGRLHYLFERKQGRSSALNAGIAATAVIWWVWWMMMRRSTNRGTHALTGVFWW